MNFLKAAAIRALKTFAQTAAAMLPLAVGVEAVDWVAVVSTSGLAAIASILTSLAGLPEVTDSTPELDRLGEIHE